MAKLPEPFDFGSPEMNAALKADQEKLEALGAFDTDDAQAAPVRDRFVRCHLDEEGKLVIDLIPDGYTDEEKELIAYWYPEHYMQTSPYVETSQKLVLTGEHALAHAYGVLKEQAKSKGKQETEEARALRLKEWKLKLQEKERRLKQQEERDANRSQQEAFAQQHMEWIDACGQRKAVIEAATAEWKKRVEERKKAIVGWDNYVAEARSAVEQAKSVPVPPRPVKPGN